MSPMSVRILIKLVSFHRLDKVFTLILALCSSISDSLNNNTNRNFVQSFFKLDQCAVTNFYFPLPDKCSIPGQRTLSLLLLA